MSLDEPMNEQVEARCAVEPLRGIDDDLMAGLGEHLDAIEARLLVTAKSHRESRRDEAAHVRRWGADA